MEQLTEEEQREAVALLQHRQQERESARRYREKMDAWQRAREETRATIERNLTICPYCGEGEQRVNRVEKLGDCDLDDEYAVMDCPDCGRTTYVQLDGNDTPSLW